MSVNDAQDAPPLTGEGPEERSLPRDVQGPFSATETPLIDGAQAISSSIFSLAVSPNGQVYPVRAVDEGAMLPPQVDRRLEKLFSHDAAHALLYLGAEEVSTQLPPAVAFWRDFARLYLHRLCATPDLESQKTTVRVAPPREELEHLLAMLPPMIGAEYVSLEVLLERWGDLEQAFHADIAAFDGTVQDWLQRRHPTWHMVGRVCFHLAENKNSPQAPFAFLATYTGRLSQQAKVQHLPLNRALKEYSSAADRDNLLKLLMPVQKAAEQSTWLKQLVDSGEIFHPLALVPNDAYRFLKDVPVFEASGVVVRLPDWWNPRRPTRPQVSVTVGSQAAGGVGLGALLDFQVRLTLEGEELTPEEWRQLLDSTGALVPLKGRWVEVDRERLNQVLEHWKAVQRAAGRDGLSFLEGMRLLAGASLDGVAPPVADDAVVWSRVVPGPWLTETLDALRDPERLGSVDPGAALRAQLRPYQQVGVRWLWTLNRLGLGACLADDMGLGKTIQVLALLLLSRQHGDPGPHLLVVPASLIANWKAEIDRFAPGLRVRIAHPSAAPMKALTSAGPLEDIDLVITSYGTVSRLEWLSETRWSMVVLDEAQAIKNPGAQQTRAVKALNARVRLALTGTPVENRLSDLWSLFDFINPGLLGSAKAFGRFAKRLAEDEETGYAPLRALVRPYILRRLKTDRRIIADLPDKLELKAFCALTPTQAALYQQSVETLREQLEVLDGMQRRGVVLAFLMRFKQICNHPSQWLGDGGFAPEESGKFARLRELCEEIAARQEKVLVFTQFQEMTGPLAGFLEGVFGRPGLVLHGGTQVRARRALVEAFQQEAGPPFFVLSLKAGGTGLTLTAASHVIHFDRWWNPAVENQATDRAFRIGQKRNVLVHKFICRGTVEEKIDALIEAKRGLSSELLEGGGEVNLSELSNDELMTLVSLDLSSAALDA